MQVETLFCALCDNGEDVDGTPAEYVVFGATVALDGLRRPGVGLCRPHLGRLEGVHRVIGRDPSEWQVGRVAELGPSDKNLLTPEIATLLELRAETEMRRAEERREQRNGGSA